jgi:uncharacterized protein (TIGR03086 family)
VTDVLELHGLAIEGFGRLVHAVPPDCWGAPTPNPGWDVRALVNHLVQEQRWVAPLLAGRRVADVGDAFDGDLLGDDPVAAWDAAAGEAHRAFTAPGALGRTVHLSYGDISAADYCREMTMDLAIHGWDLARGAGLDERIDPRLVDDLLARYADQADDLAASGLFAPRVAVPADAAPQTRLLAIFGRDAR